MKMKTNSAISVKVSINSSCEDVLEMKCCNLAGMNLEITIYNHGPHPIVIASEMELIGAQTSEPLPYLYPHGLQTIAPRDLLSFYCPFDEHRFKNFAKVVVKDCEGKRCQATITGDKEPTELMN